MVLEFGMYDGGWCVCVCAAVWERNFHFSLLYTAIRTIRLNNINGGICILWFFAKFRNDLKVSHKDEFTETTMKNGKIIIKH